MALKKKTPPRAGATKAPAKKKKPATASASRPAKKPAAGRTAAPKPKKKPPRPVRKVQKGTRKAQAQKPPAAEPTAPPAENPQARALAEQVAHLLSEKKGLDIVILDVRGKTSYADYLVIASGESERQVTSMADHVEAKLKEQGTRPLGSEGQDTGNWVLLDYGEVVGHLFYSEARGFYDLEGLWADVPRERVA